MFSKISDLCYAWDTKMSWNSPTFLQSCHTAKIMSDHPSWALFFFQLNSQYGCTKYNITRPDTFGDFWIWTRVISKLMCILCCCYFSNLRRNSFHVLLGVPNKLTWRMQNTFNLRSSTMHPVNAHPVLRGSFYAFHTHYASRTSCFSCTEA